MEPDAQALVAVASGVIKLRGAGVDIIDGRVQVPANFVAFTIPAAFPAIRRSAKRVVWTFVLSRNFCIARRWLAEVSLLPNPHETGACRLVWLDLLVHHPLIESFIVIFLTNTFKPEPHHHAFDIRY